MASSRFIPSLDRVGVLTLVDSVPHAVGLAAAEGALAVAGVACRASPSSRPGSSTKAGDGQIFVTEGQLFGLSSQEGLEGIQSDPLAREVGVLVR